jgi:hypothetical protein
MLYNNNNASLNTTASETLKDDFVAQTGLSRYILWSWCVAAAAAGEEKCC